MPVKKALTATEAIAKLRENDPIFVSCDLSNNAVRPRTNLPLVACS